MPASIEPTVSQCYREIILGTSFQNVGAVQLGRRLGEYFRVRVVEATQSPSSGLFCVVIPQSDLEDAKLTTAILRAYFSGYKAALGGGR